MEILEASTKDIPTIQHLANIVWPPTFASILSETQIEYMIDMMYSAVSLENQMANGCHYLLVKDEGEFVGYVSYQLDEDGKGTTKIHKIYVLPAIQRKGFGHDLVDYVANLALKKGDKMLTLNVNRYNPALSFYEKNNFTILREEDIDIGEGFLMEDYVMVRNL